MPNFHDQISAIQNGEEVSAGVTNRPLIELLENDLVIRQRLDSLLQGRAVIDTNAQIAESVQVGQAVYFHAGLGRYEPALASVFAEPSGRLLLSQAAYVQGIVISKNYPNVGDVLLAGVASVDLSQAISGTITPGAYFLSDALPGKLVSSPPTVAILVCVVGNYVSSNRWRVHVTPRMMDLVFYTLDSAVLSLQAEPQTGLQVVRVPSGLPASTGHLLLKRNESLRRDPDDDAQGFLALKHVDDEGYWHFGPMVEGLKVSGRGVSLASTGPALPNGYRTGRIHLTLSEVPSGMELPAFELRLDGVSTQYFKDVPTLMFPAGTSVSLRGSIFVPKHLELPPGTSFHFVFWGLSRAAGAIPGNLLSLSYRRIARPGAHLSEQPLPATDTILPLSMGMTLSASDHYYSFMSDSFSAEAGDLILFTLARNGSSAYPYDFHVIRQSLTVQLDDAWISLSLGD